MAYGGTAVKSYTGDFSSPVKVVVSSKLKKPKLEFKIKKRKIYIDLSGIEGDKFYVQFKQGNGKWKDLASGKIKDYISGLNIDVKKGKKVFYLRIRSSMKIKGKTVYSKWSPEAEFISK